MGAGPVIKDGELLGTIGGQDEDCAQRRGWVLEGLSHMTLCKYSGILEASEPAMTGEEGPKRPGNGLKGLRIALTGLPVELD